MQRYLFFGAVFFALNGAIHGVWSHRWEAWTDAEVSASVERIDEIPLQVGEWDGERQEIDPLTLPEEVVGRSVTVRYKNRVDGNSVFVFLTCGPTDGLVSHTPRVCYKANGYACPISDLRISPPLKSGPVSEFWVSTFSKPDALVPLHLRVFWAWSDGNGWQVPGNPRRTFRRNTVIYKSYFIRPITSPDEPLDGDPCVQLMTALLPKLNEVLSAKQ